MFCTTKHNVQQCLIAPTLPVSCKSPPCGNHLTHTSYILQQQDAVWQLCSALSEKKPNNCYSGNRVSYLCLKNGTYLDIAVLTKSWECLFCVTIYCCRLVIGRMWKTMWVALDSLEKRDVCECTTLNFKQGEKPHFQRLVYTEHEIRMHWHYVAMLFFLLWLQSKRHCSCLRRAFFLFQLLLSQLKGN